MLLANYMEEAANVLNATLMAICTEAESLTNVNDGEPHATPPPSPKDALYLAGFYRCNLRAHKQEGANGQFIGQETEIEVKIICDIIFTLLGFENKQAYAIVFCLILMLNTLYA